jgi:hypothetical protein
LKSFFYSFLVLILFTLLLAAPKSLANEIDSIEIIQLDSSSKNLIQKPNISGDTLADNALFYHNQNYGSESQFGPLNVFLNVGMMLAGRFNYSDNIYEIDYATQSKNVARSILLPHETTRENGVWGLFKNEVIPFWPGATGAWSPNYSLHLIGEGMLYRKLSEKFTQDSIPFPKTLAVVSLMTAQMMNEIVENGVDRHQNTDALADFWFNTAGILLFNWDGFAELFTESVQIHYWPGQAAITLPDGALINHMESYAWKINLGSWTQKKLFIGSGLPSSIGITSPQNAEDNFTYALGVNAGDRSDQALIEAKNYNDTLKSEDPNKLTSIPLSTMYPALTFYWDRQNSLMFRGLIGYSKDLHLDFNFYPGFWHFKSLPIGAYFLSTGIENVSIGLTAPIGLVPGYRYKK